MLLQLTGVETVQLLLVFLGQFSIEDLLPLLDVLHLRIQGVQSLELELVIRLLEHLILGRQLGDHRLEGHLGAFLPGSLFTLSAFLAFSTLS